MNTEPRWYRVTIPDRPALSGRSTLTSSTPARNGEHAVRIVARQHGITDYDRASATPIPNPWP